jgi:hypothetical protein
LLLGALSGFVLYEMLMLIGSLTGRRPLGQREAVDAMRSVHDVVVFTAIPVGLSVGVMYVQAERLVKRCLRRDS